MPRSTLNNLAITESDRRTEHLKRRKSYDEATFPTPLQSTKEQEGWTLVRQNKASVRMRTRKIADEILENRFWNILYLFGYAELNRGRHFTVPISKKDPTLTKQIDVFGRDAETIVIAECKTAIEPKKRSLQLEIGEFAANRKRIANALTRHYGSEFKPKIIWFFVTDNIRWSNADLQRAKEFKIHVVQARELLYLEEISKKLGVAAKYQFHAEFLANQPIPALANRKVPAVRTKLGGKICYFFSARPIDILRIAFVNHRDLRDPSGAPSYQRLVSPTRLKEIGRFLNNKGYFPNTILLNFRRKPRFDRVSKDQLAAVHFGELTLPDCYKSCWVVDGQHRLYGTTFATTYGRDDPLLFIGLEGVSAVEEANTFITINEKQTKVSRKLLSELDGELKWDSENPREKLSAIASRAVDLLNNEGGGPFENTIAPPGVVAKSNQPLTLPSFQQAILKSKLIGSVNARTKEFLTGPCWEKDSESTLIRLVTFLTWYFQELEQISPHRWSSGKQGYLCSNFGVHGHVRLLGELIRFASSQDHFNPAEMELRELQSALADYLDPVWSFIRSADDEEFIRRFKVPFGSGGQARYFFKLVEIVRTQHDAFEPEGFEDFVETVSEEQVRLADSRVRWIQRVVPEYVVDVLKDKGGDHFFEKYVPRDIQKACQAKRIDDDLEQQLPVEGYLEWLHIKKIVERRELREWFLDSLSIQMPGEKSGKHLYSHWFDRINGIRRISAHPAGRKYRDEDVEELEYLVNELAGRLPGPFRGPIP